MPWLSLLSEKRNSFKGLKAVVFLRLSTKEIKQAFFIQIGTWPSFRSIETHSPPRIRARLHGEFQPGLKFCSAHRAEILS